MAQIVMPTEQVRKLRLLANLPNATDFLYAKGQQLSKRNVNPCICLLGKQLARSINLGRRFSAPANWRGFPTRRQHDQTPIFEFEQQSAGCHILELATRAAPLPEQCQMPAHPPAAPVPMRGEQQAHLRELRFADESALNDARFEHNPDHAGERKKSPEKNENIFLGKIPLHPALPPLPCGSGQMT